MRTLISATLLLALTACGGGDEPDVKADAGPTVDLTATLEACNDEVQAALDEATGNGPGLSPGTVMRLGDGGKTLDVSPLQTAPFLVDPSAAAAMCVLREAKAPDSVRSEVSQVSGLDGRQQAEWDGVSLTYSYDGNTGFTGVFTAAE